jgi:hypothetical protein
MTRDQEQALNDARDALYSAQIALHQAEEAIHEALVASAHLLPNYQPEQEDNS